jgi:arabinan endo-1,5-alpha-L-arabinosidase
VRCSHDLEHWKLCGHVFDAIPPWILARSPCTKDLWAPDISHVHHEYRLYYAYSLFGKNASGVALATNKTLDPTSPTFKTGSRTQAEAGQLSFLVGGLETAWQRLGQF